MRVGVALPNYGPLASPAVLGRLAGLAEALGADGVWVSDHLVLPRATATPYPYDRRDRPAPADLRGLDPFYDPLPTLGWLAARTERVHLGVSAYVLPYRHPVVTAKQVATLDALSGGRVVLAVGAGWLREEFDALGVPFAGRGRRMEDYLAICTALWRDGGAVDTPTCRVPAVRSGPAPVQRPRPPVWIAGNGDTAVDRAARLGDGWHGIDLAPDALAGRIRLLHERTAAHGRDREAVAVTMRVQTGGASPDAVRARGDAYRAAGLDYLVAGLGRPSTVDEAARALETALGALTERTG